MSRRWVVAVLLLVATTINYIDRQAISVAAPVLSREFSFTARDYSQIVFAFLLAYAVMQVVSGGLVDRLGTRLGFAVAIVGWSLANMLHAAGRSVLGFASLRFLLGAFEAANYPAALKAIAEWFPRSERSQAVGLLNVGPGLGAVLAPPLVAWLMLRWGWPLMFVATGLLGFLWLGPWLWLSRGAPAVRPGAAEESRTAWRDLLADRRLLGLMLARFASDGAFYFFVFWLPKYLADVRGFGLAQIGAFAWIPFLAADVGSLAGGFAGTALIRRGWSLDASRKGTMWAGASLAAAAWPAAEAPAPWLALAFVAVAMFGIQVKSSSLFTVPADLYPPGAVARAWGLTGAAGSIGGMLFQLYIGSVVDRIGYGPVFAAVSGMHLLSTALVVIFVRRIEGNAV